MPRKQFMADLHQAKQGKVASGIHDLRAGEEDGQFEFSFVNMHTSASQQQHVNITAMITELADYPASHEYILFCGEDAPLHVGEALQDMRCTKRKSVSELLDIVFKTLSRPRHDSDGDTVMPDSQQRDEPSEDEDQTDIYADDYLDDDDDDNVFTTPVSLPSNRRASQAALTTSITPASRAFRDRIRFDLCAIKNASFRVGILGSLLDAQGAFVSVSIRMSKLGVSGEAMQAWQVEPSDYLVLLLHYPNGYMTNEQLQSFDSFRLKRNISMHVHSCPRYKPTLQEAIKSFTKVQAGRETAARPVNHGQSAPSSLRDLFISKSLNALLEESLVPILRFRGMGMDWSGAEAWYHDSSEDAKLTADTDNISNAYLQPEKPNDALPAIVNGDHLATHNGTQYSFPLLAIQFTLRHFVRCTDFCLVCHRKTNSELEALKPYVCDRPLCLFQYMAMGFGPSIEHEILAQPYVVDLLVSFCYASAAQGKLKDFPVGLGMVVPPVVAPISPPPMHSSAWAGGAQPGISPPLPSTTSPEYSIGFDRDRRELIFFDMPAGGCPVARGNWIVIKAGDKCPADGAAIEHHCRISKTSFYPTLYIDEHIAVQSNPATFGHVIARQPLDGKQDGLESEDAVTPAATSDWDRATFTKYDGDFDQLEAGSKCAAICKVLDSLPSVMDMQKYLISSHPSELSRWVERISPAALSLLRWIIASNRACIMQVDGGARSNKTDADGQAHAVSSAEHERLYGMKDYVQFRFAMGAPDKEQRFLSSVRKTTQRLILPYPTMFAWHGSPLANWHMIIREGLHFKNADHGRAYGHGVYHARDAHTSLGYTGRSQDVPWSNSVLRVTKAVALNELVNVPEEYVSASPYYVVGQLDWIQTRYLFVQCSPTYGTELIGEERKPKKAHPQDPQRTPTGISDRVVIPASAIKSGRPQTANTERDLIGGGKALKKRKGINGNAVAVDEGSEDASSNSDEDDLEALADETEPDPTKANLHGKNGIPKDKKSNKKIDDESDFVPGSLDYSTLPLMPMPTYAETGTTKRLMNEVKSMQKVMGATPLGELGWYMDVQKIDNVYQWIVELHSFHDFEVKGKPLPLVADMKQAEVKSIVLEVRFGPDFPYSPPYVRVVRPRFRSFAQGGGGHVVMGGAMCMELLTNTGWSSISSMESVLMQVRLAIASEPFARLDRKSRGDYGSGEAADGFTRACRAHGWKEPPGFKQIVYGLAGED